MKQVAMRQTRRSKESNESPIVTVWHACNNLHGALQTAVTTDSFIRSMSFIPYMHYLLLLPLL
jgi:hypothetical protein